MRTKQIVAAEADDDVIQPIRARLESRGEFRVEVVATADEVLRRIASALPDGLLIDTALPDRPAQEICRVLRSRPRTENLPCIMLGTSGRGLRSIDALEFGADDFLTKPIDPIELEARLHAVLRRRAPAPVVDAVEEFCGRRIRANFANVAVSVDGATISLTKRELLLLHALVGRCNQTLSRDALLARVWGSAAWDCRIVDSAMWKLRRKLRGAGDRIETVIGFGYRFNEPREPARGGTS